jgi:predicted nucleotidyltransferase
MNKSLRPTSITHKRLNSLHLMLKKRMRKRKVSRKKKVVPVNGITPLIKRHLQVLKKKEMMILEAVNL